MIPKIWEICEVEHCIMTPDDISTEHCRKKLKDGLPKECIATIIVMEMFKEEFKTKQERIWNEGYIGRVFGTNKTIFDKNDLNEMLLRTEDIV